MRSRIIAVALALAAACWSVTATAEGAASSGNPPAAAPATGAAAAAAAAAAATAPKQRPAGCAVVSSLRVPLSICLMRGEWAYAQFAPAAEHSIKNLKQEVYLMMLGETTKLTMAQMKDAILANAKSAVTIQKFREDGKVDLDAHQFGHLVFDGTVQGQAITYEYYYTTFAAGGAVQLIMYTTTAAFDALAPVRASVVDTVRVDDGAH